MSTFAELEQVVRRTVGGAGVDVQTVLREAENEFIKIAQSTEQEATVSTDEGYISLPSDYLKLIAAYFNGTQLRRTTKLAMNSFRQSDGTIATGSPRYYWISDGGIRLFPAPSSSGTLVLHYIRFNNDSDSTSPIIHSQWHSALTYYAIAEILGYQDNLTPTQEKTISRNEQKWAEAIQNIQNVRIIDQVGDDGDVISDRKENFYDTVNLYDPTA